MVNLLPIFSIVDLSSRIIFDIPLSMSLRLSICGFIPTVWSMMIPRYLYDSCVGILKTFWNFTHLLLLNLMFIISDLFRLMSILFLQHRFRIMSIDLSTSVLPLQITTISSAYILTNKLLSVNCVIRSSRDRLNMYGDNHDPCPNPLYVSIVLPL